jgi:hypothetical protein
VPNYVLLYLQLTTWFLELTILTRFSNLAQFFADTKGLDGGCAWVELAAGDILIMPPFVIHFVITPEDSIVFGANFIDPRTLADAVETFREERTKELPLGECMPNFYVLLHLHLWFVHAYILKVRTEFAR